MDAATILAIINLCVTAAVLLPIAWLAWGRRAPPRGSGFYHPPRSPAGKVASSPKAPPKAVPHDDLHDWKREQDERKRGE